MHLFRRSRTRRQVTSLIRHRVGVHEASWDVPESVDSPAAGALVSEIVGWICESMATMRRPYGIDQVAVAFACRDASGQVMCSNSFGVMRPADFYGEKGQQRVRAFLGDVDSVPAGRRVEIVGAVLSLGDLAYAMDRSAA